MRTKTKSSQVTLGFTLKSSCKRTAQALRDFFHRHFGSIEALFTKVPETRIVRRDAYKKITVETTLSVGQLLKIIGELILAKRSDAQVFVLT